MVLFVRVPYYIGDLERDPNSENFPYYYKTSTGGPYGVDGT